MRPLRSHQAENGFHVVDGTPTDCVHLALTGLLDDKPDMVVSGINSGPNLGDDVIYSGTVAGAIEGRFLGLPALAVSLVGKPGNHYESAARVTANLIEQMRANPIGAESILNINVPDIAFEQLASVEATRLGFRHKAEAMTREKDPYGAPIYWVGPPGEIQDAGEGTDFYAVSKNRVSVTPLQVDMTRHQSIKSLGQWLRANGNDC